MSPRTPAAAPLLDWDAVYNPGDASVSVSLGLMWLFPVAEVGTADLQSDPDAFWADFAEQVHEEVSRLMLGYAGREALTEQLRTVLGPVGPLLGRALARRLEAMIAEARAEADR